MAGLPNVLSCLRIVLALLLVLLSESPALFTITYIVCGITDIADGYIARKYNAATKLGSKLDSLGDFIFWAVVVAVLFFRTSIYTDSLVLTGGLVVTIMRAANFLITKIKFKQWGMLHSTGNKAAGLALYLALPICVLLGYMPLYLAIPVFIIALLSALEEMAILVTSNKYNANRKSLATKD
ncbi:pgsA: CDP-diacylglycerol--glycerol-3-phosphate 3-phosphatidyltransferase [Sporomusa termitida]|uniref:PgsA: CDP-diacylglycerol--glycerol-3-phosphate 3-phosphatidyltransferase n=2 Tax=Sporomusa termitida TaxID=2377 RepID=A0A517DRP2_9FIRM|nr:pgsA: CDP-diacylglycerol--glycerol-3-phosphate 3-phosphatidyltransferase [Sporomusa termitida]